jgi:hypothetical protein
MSRRFLFVICFVLVLGFSSGAWADAIDVNNFSFELAEDGNRVPGHASVPPPWGENSHYPDAGFVGVDVQCPWADSEHCHRWPGPTETGSGTDVVYCYLEHSADYGTNVYQVLDMNNSDANAVIEAGRRYTLTFDATIGDPDESGNPITGSLFYPGDVTKPDVNHYEVASKTYPVLWIDRPLGDCQGTSSLDSDDQCPDWNYDLTVKYVSEAGSPAIGKTLGVKLMAEALAQTNWTFVDNIRVEWEWATKAYDPSPEDEAKLVTKNPTLTWKPGSLAYQHEVYFGTDETVVDNASSSNTTGLLEFDVCDVNNYTPSGPLVLGETYYWKITEVNSGYGGTEPPPGPWEGDVWSFRVEGHAYDPSPFDGERDVVFLGLELEWTAGAEATHHMVYIGTDETSVADATTSSDEYKTTLTVGTEVYSPGGQLTVGKKYYWRIDEKSAVHPDGLKGDVWSFLVGSFLVVENFESYLNNTELTDVWDDGFAPTNISTSQIFLEEDVNIVRSVALNPKALNFVYYAYDKDGDWIDAQDMTELDIGSDWTVGGVKGLMLWMRGDPCSQLNATANYTDAWPWVELEDTSSNSGYVLYPADEVTDVIENIWHEWNIDLNDANFSGVTMSAIDRVTIGVGGPKAGQSKAGTKVYNNLWFDDIRLYPPRCRPEVSKQTGDFTADCEVDYEDLDIMVTDWLLRDGYFPTSQMNMNVNEVNGTVAWVTGYDGNYALEFDGNEFHADLCEPGLTGLTNMSITAWVKRDGDLEWVGIVSSRETVDGQLGATELGIPGSYGGAGGKNTVEYCWNEIEATWKFNSGLLIPDQTWTFVAMALDPTGCDLYMRPIGQAVQKSDRHNLVYDPGPLIHWKNEGWIGRGKVNGGYFKGGIDDVRIYDITLDANEIAWISSDGAEGYEPNCPAFWYKLDEGAGLTSVDDGCGAIVYRPVQSRANLTDPEPIESRFVNFHDYDILADNWLKQKLWP